MLFHGVSKLTHGIAGIIASVDKRGLPHAFAYGVYVGEVIAPLLIVAGFYSRPAALVLAFNMVVAVWLAHSGDVFTLGQGGKWGIELQALFGFGAVAIALLGAGRYSASRGKGKWD
jgi:putative oxidoreductase